MYNLVKKIPIIIVTILFFSTITIYAVDNNLVQNNTMQNSITQNNTIQNNTRENSTLQNNEDINTLTQDSSAKTLVDIKEEQLSSIEDYKAKYGSDTYGIVAYILHLVQIYSIPLGIVGIAICAIYEYVIGLKRLDIRDKGFNTMIAVVTIIIICQILPLVFAVVVKSTD